MNVIYNDVKHMKNIGWVIAVVGIIAVAVAGYFAWNELKDTPGGLGWVDDYKDATYIIEGKPITLTDGSYEAPAAPGSALKEVTQYFGNEAQGDLDGDGDEDVAFLLIHSGGGSGTFYYLVGAIKGENGYYGTNAMYIGDRIAPQTTEFKDGQVIVNYADRGPQDGMATQPYIGKSLYAKYSADTNDFGEVVQDFEGESAMPVKRIVAKMGETKSALGVTLTPREIMSDSRCATDVTCVWAGTVEVKTTMKSGLGTAEQIFKLNEPVTTEAEEITLLRVDPAPKSTVTIKLSDYVFTFEVKKR